MPRFATVALFTAAACGLLGACPGCGAPQNRIVDYQTVPKVPRRDVETARRHNAAALEHIAQSQWADARQQLKLALQADITFGPAHNNLGKVYYHEDELYLAAWEFQYAIDLMPHHPEPRNNLGMVMEATGRYDAAVDHYEQARSLAPDHPQIIGNLVRARIARGDRDEQTRDLLQELALKDSRDTWREWAARQLLRMSPPDVDEP